MFRRSITRRGGALAVGALTLVAAATAGLGSQAVGAATVTHGHTLQLTSRNTTSILFIPCSDCIKVSVPDGAHIGGTEVDAGDLIDPSGHKVGHFAIDSIGATPFTQAGPGELMLNTTLVIGNDQITAQGLEEPPLDHGTVAITGGTGRFRSARGEITFTDNQDGSQPRDRHRPLMSTPNQILEPGQAHLQPKTPQAPASAQIEPYRSRKVTMTRTRARALLVIGIVVTLFALLGITNAEHTGAKILYAVLIPTGIGCAIYGYTRLRAAGKNPN